MCFTSDTAEHSFFKINQKLFTKQCDKISFFRFELLGVESDQIHSLNFHALFEEFDQKNSKISQKFWYFLYYENYVKFTYLFS